MTTLRALVRRGLTVKPVTEKVLENHEMDWLALGISTMPDFWERYTGGQKGRSSETPLMREGNSRPASIIIKPSRWAVVTGNARMAQRGSLDSNEKPEGIEAINVRMRLGELTKWNGPAHKLAVALASAIESVMQTFFDGELSSEKHSPWRNPYHNATPVLIGKGKSVQKNNSSEEIIASPETRNAPVATSVRQPTSTTGGNPQQHNETSAGKHPPKHSRFTWVLKIEDNDKPRDVHLDVRRSDEDTKWKIKVPELEALLSLWLFDFQTHPIILESFRSNARTRVLGPKTPGLDRDLDWWMSDDVNRGINRTGHSVPARPDLTIGFCGVDTYPRLAPTSEVAPGPSNYHRVDSDLKPEEERRETDRLSMITTSPVETLLAQHIFSSFMWAVSEHIPSGKINKRTTAVKKGAFFNANDITSLLSCRLENPTITGLAADIERTGLVSLDEAYTFIIPPLSVANQLPVEVMADFIRENAKEHEVNMRWEDAANIYTHLIPAIKSLPSEDRFVIKAYAAVVEFYQLMTTYVNLTPQPPGKITRLSHKVDVLYEALKAPEYAHFLRIVQGLYIIQCRHNDYLLFGAASNLLPRMLEEYKSEGNRNFYKHTDLHLAIILNETPISKISRSNVNAKDIVDWSPLHYAVTRESSTAGYKETVRVLLEQRADPNAKDIADWTPFHYVAQSGEKIIGEDFVKWNVGFNNPTRNGMLPIHCAAKGGNVGMTELLLDLEGVDINAVDHIGWTPLHYAAWNGRDEIVRLLLGRDARYDIEDKFGATALLRASQNNRRSTVKLFASMLPNILYHAVQTGNITIVRILLENDIDLNTYNDDHETPLHIACRGGHLDIIKSLLVHKANPNLPDKDHRTVLHNAVRIGKLEIVKLLAERGVEMEIGCGKKYTALHYAALEGHTEITRFLIGKGASVQARDTQLRTPLHCAIESKNEEVVQLLLAKSSAEVNTSDYDGRTPLHCAVFLDINSMIPILLEHKASLAKSCGWGMFTALHIATRKGSAETVALLLSHGANTEARCAQKRTPLHYAAMSGREDIANLLIKADAHTDAVNEEGKTPYDEAVELGRTEIVELLRTRDRGSD
jgi:ankyrin repeat protein